MNQPSQIPRNQMSEDETPETELELGRLRLLQARHRALALTGRIPDSLRLPKTTPEKMDSPHSHPIGLKNRGASPVETGADKVRPLGGQVEL